MNLQKKKEESRQGLREEEWGTLGPGPEAPVDSVQGCQLPTDTLWKFSKFIYMGAGTITVIK